MGKVYAIAAIACAAILSYGCSSSSSQAADEQEAERNIVFGIDAEGYELDKCTVERGDTWSRILDSYGIDGQRINRLDRLAADVCPLRQIRARNN